MSAESAPAARTTPLAGAAPAARATPAAGAAPAAEGAPAASSPPGPHLAVDFEQHLGTLSLQVAFTASAPRDSARGAWTVLFGASGSGKSTILRAIAGLAQPTRGSISIAGLPVFDSARGLCLAPRRRPVRWSGQAAALFPHLTVEQNLGFACGSGFGSGFGFGYSAPARRQRTEIVARALQHFQLEALARRLPSQLSGGEQQRVALVRAAIASHGSLLLLDEPFTGLDASLRVRLVEDLRAWLGNTPVLSVTHSVAEAFLLGAEVLRLTHGRISAQGAADSVLAEERDRLRNLLG